MLLHLLYILTFTVLAFLAVWTLIRNLMTLGIESQRHYAPRSQDPQAPSPRSPGAFRSQLGQPLHPELLDEYGRVINEPLLVMRSMTVEDAREHLDALYNASPNPTSPNSESSEVSREDP